MNRDDLKALTKARLRDARTLLKAKSYDAAYYLAGYAVECALKACIAKSTKQFDFPDKDVVLKSYTHDLGDLARLANLWPEVLRRADLDDLFKAHWNAVEAWREKSRYQLGRSHKQAKALYFAITSREHGVLGCTKSFW